jgi:hypothetical protein
MQGRWTRDTGGGIETTPFDGRWPDAFQPTESVTPRGDSDLLENLPTEACIESTRRILSRASSFPTQEARSRAVLETDILFIAEYGTAA